MNDYFDQPERVERLRNEILSWVGTPFRLHACVKGPRGGVDCVKLAYVVMTNVGAAPAGKQFPDYTADHTVHNDDSLVRKFMREELADFFAELPADTPLKPGDILGIKIGREVHHMTVVVDEHMMLQAHKPYGARLVSLDDPTYMDRVAVVYRAKEVQSWLS